MSNYNSLLVSHFKGCRQCHEFADQHRGRTVKVFDVNDTEVLGVSDGIDAWMVSATGAINGKTCHSLLLNTVKVKRHALLLDNDDSETPTFPTRRSHAPRTQLRI